MAYRNRQSHRLRGYDYTQSGAYFVTISAYRGEHRFGEVKDGEMHLNIQGNIAAAEWSQTEVLRDTVTIDAFVVMPNHTHAIIMIDNENPTSDGGGTGAARCARTKDGVTPNNVAPKSLGAIIRAYKSAVTRRIHRLPDAPTGPVWHRNYHDHIIRHEQAYHQIRRYIYENPSRWESDTYYTA